LRDLEQRTDSHKKELDKSTAPLNDWGRIGAENQPRKTHLRPAKSIKTENGPSKRYSHNPKVAGSNPAPATTYKKRTTITPQKAA